MGIGGLTDKEEEDWCKDKKDYVKLIKQGNLTAADRAKIQRMAEEYRDWNRYHKLINGKNSSLKYSPKQHKSKIFAKLSQGGY